MPEVETVHDLSFCKGLLSSNPEEQLNAIRQIRRFVTGDGCSSNVSLVVQSGLVPQIVHMLSYHQKPLLMLEAAWAITNISAGNSADTKAVVEAGAIPALVDLLVSQIDGVTERAAGALANIAGDGPVFQQQVLLSGVVKALIGWLKKPSLPVSSVKIAALTICNLCRSSSNQLPPPIDEIVQFIPVLVQLACYPDPEVQKKICWSFYYMTRQRKTTDIVEKLVQAGVVICLAQLLAHIDQEVINIALNVLINITAGSDEQIQAVIDNGILASLGSLLYHPNEKIQASSAWVISNVLCGTFGHVQSVLDENLMESMMHVFQTGESSVQQQLKTAVVKLLYRGTEQLIKLAEDRGLVRVLQQVVSPEDYEEIFSQRNSKACTDAIEEDIEHLRKQLKDI